MPQENVLDLRPKKAATPSNNGWWPFQRGVKKEKIDLPARSPSKVVELPINRVVAAETHPEIEQELDWTEEPVLIEPQPKKRLTKKAVRAEHRQHDSELVADSNAAGHHRRLTKRQAWVAVGVFAALGVAVMVPSGISRLMDTAKATQGSVLDLAHGGFDSFQSATASVKDQQFGQAADEFKSAATQFSQAREQLNNVSHGLVAATQYLPGSASEPASVDHLLLIGEHVSGAGNSLSQSAQMIADLDISALRQNDELGLTTVLVVLHATLRQAQNHLDIATLASSEVDVNDLPPDVQLQVNQLLTHLPTAKTEIDHLVQSVEVALGVLGHDEPRRYLVLFQNNRELRATGGFLGSFAMLDVDKGVVKKITIPGGGIYDVAGQFGEKIQAPKPLALVNPYWNIQDANWWPDFPTSAKKVEWFWGKSGGPTVDGVITLTPTVIEDLLRLTGPIDLTETYGVVIDADNFYETVQLRAEAKYDETNQSKQILADLTPILFNQLFSLQGDQLLAALTALQNSLTQKDILLYSDQDMLEREIASAGWGGLMRDAPGDYLMVVDTNIGGGKTDGVIDETISHHVDIDNEGNVIDTVQVTRHHRGVVGDPLTGVNNMDYMRFYVPQGSQLISAQGFTEPDATKIQAADPGVEIDPDYVAISGEVLQEEQTGMRISAELGKTLFANWVEVKPGESTTVSISYKLPFTVQASGWFEKTAAYSLLLQKQPGSFDPYVAFSLDLPDNLQVTSATPENAGASVGFVLDQDREVQVELVGR